MVTSANGSHAIALTLTLTTHDVWITRYIDIRYITIRYPAGRYFCCWLRLPRRPHGLLCHANDVMTIITILDMLVNLLLKANRPFAGSISTITVLVSCAFRVVYDTATWGWLKWSVVKSQWRVRSSWHFSKVELACPWRSFDEWIAIGEKVVLCWRRCWRVAQRRSHGTD